MDEMRLISEKNLENICKHRAFTFYEDSHARGYYYCQLCGWDECKFQCSEEAYSRISDMPITKEEQENNCRIVREFLRDIAQVKDLPACKECRSCRNCKSKNAILPHIIWMNDSPFIYCRKHKEHFAPNDTCEFWDDKGGDI